MRNVRKKKCGRKNGAGALNVHQSLLKKLVKIGTNILSHRTKDFLFLCHLNWRKNDRQKMANTFQT